MTTIAYVTIGVIFAFLILATWKAALVNFDKWGSERFKLCRKCATKDAGWRFQVKRNDPFYICDACIVTEFGANAQMLRDKGYLFRREATDGKK